MNKYTLFAHVPFRRLPNEKSGHVVRLKNLSLCPKPNQSGREYNGIDYFF